jgi:hypothetical protein
VFWFLILLNISTKLKPMTFFGRCGGAAPSKEVNQIIFVRVLIVKFPASGEKLGICD